VRPGHQLLLCGLPASPRPRTLTAKRLAHRGPDLRPMLLAENAAIELSGGAWGRPNAIGDELLKFRRGQELHRSLLHERNGHDLVLGARQLLGALPDRTFRSATREKDRGGVTPQQSNPARVGVAVAGAADPRAVRADARNHIAAHLVVLSPSAVHA